MLSAIIISLRDKIVDVIMLSATIQCYYAGCFMLSVIRLTVISLNVNIVVVIKHSGIMLVVLSLVSLG